MSAPAPRRPLHPYSVLAIAAVLPGVGQAINNTPLRGMIMALFMVMLGLITYKLAAPGISLVGRFSGGIFIYMLSILDAYYWARYRWELFTQSPRSLSDR